MLAPWTAAAFCLLVADLDGNARVGVTVVQRSGSVPRGDAAGTTVLAYDSELTPEINYRLADSRFELNLLYNPRLLLRVQGDNRGLLRANGRPFLILHNLEASSGYRFAHRWSWFARLQGVTGEQDFAQFALDGAGVGGGTGGGGANTGTGGAIIEGQVIESTSFSAETGIIGPFLRHGEFQLTASMNLTLASTDGALPMAEPEDTTGPQNVICVLDRGEPVGNQVALADTCRLQIQASTNNQLSALSNLRVQFAYSIVDFDPGPFANLVEASARLSRIFDRSLTGRLGLGAILSVIEAEGFATEVRPLPVVELGLNWRFINLRRLQSRFDLAVIMDGFADTVAQQFLLRASATAGIQVEVGRKFRSSLSVIGFTLAPERGSPPLDPRDGGGAPLNELSSLSGDLTLTWSFDDVTQFFVGGRFGIRGPHLSEIGGESDVPSQGQYTGFIGLRWSYGSRRMRQAGGDAQAG